MSIYLNVFLVKFLGEHVRLRLEDSPARTYVASLALYMWIRCCLLGRQKSFIVYIKVYHVITNISDRDCSLMCLRWNIKTKLRTRKELREVRKPWGPRKLSNSKEKWSRNENGVKFYWRLIDELLRAIGELMVRRLLRCKQSITRPHALGSLELKRFSLKILALLFCFCVRTLVNVVQREPINKTFYWRLVLSLKLPQIKFHGSLASTDENTFSTEIISRSSPEPARFKWKIINSISFCALSLSVLPRWLDEGPNGMLMARLDFRKIFSRLKLNN